MSNSDGFQGLQSKRLKIRIKNKLADGSAWDSRWPNTPPLPVRSAFAAFSREHDEPLGTVHTPPSAFPVNSYAIGPNATPGFISGACLLINIAEKRSAKAAWSAALYQAANHPWD
jgi:hypothetical protein